MSKVINATQSDFDEVVMKSDLPVLVDFWAPWCGPCRMMAPILDELSDSMAGSLKIVKVDVDEPSNQALATQYEIRSIPSLKLIKKGEVIAEFLGLRTKEALEQEIKGALV
ncbi:MAG: thioredoxin [Candidatus Taylorbacteria bacterium]